MIVVDIPSSLTLAWVSDAQNICFLRTHKMFWEAATGREKSFATAGEILVERSNPKTEHRNRICVVIGCGGTEQNLKENDLHWKFSTEEKWEKEKRVKEKKEVLRENEQQSRRRKVTFFFSLYTTTPLALPTFFIIGVGVCVCRWLYVQQNSFCSRLWLGIYQKRGELTFTLSQGASRPTRPGNLFTPLYFIYITGCKRSHFPLKKTYFTSSSSSPSSYMLCI